MSKLSTAVKLIKQKPNVFFAALLVNFSFLFPDKLYLKLMFRCKMGYWMDFENPKTFSEKLQWLKLYNRNPLYTTLVDKYAVKRWVADKIGEEYIIPTLGVWENANEIDFDSLPDQFVLKTTNGGGGDVIVCMDKSKLDTEKTIKHLNQSLKNSIYNNYREWAYKNVQPRIIAEKYIEDENQDLMDYKFFCFDGHVECLQVDYDRFVEHHRNMYDVNWNVLPFSLQYPSRDNVVINKPQNLNDMIKIAQILSINIPHVRVDLYNVKGQIYFGELTFYHGSGYEKFSPNEWNLKFGEWLRLQSKRI